MRIGFDAKRYYHNKTGLGNYSRDLVDALKHEYPNEDFYLLDKPNLENLYQKNQIQHTQSAGPFWRLHGILNDIKTFNLDVFHGLSNELPYGNWPENTKKVVTIHDVIYKLYPHQYPLFDRLIYHQKTKHAIAIADTIIATSQATANDLILHYKANENKVKVVYQTCGNAHWKSYSVDEINGYKKKQNLNYPFLLYVSSFQQRKNHLALIKAFALLQNKTIKLVLAGRKGDTYLACKKLIEELNLQSQILFLTDLETADLPLLYRSAHGFVYPSMIEGFGIPLIEAACAGLPIAVNNINVFKEIAPQGTLYFDINNPQIVAETLSNLAQMPKTDYSLHLLQFTPKHCAEKVFEVYKILS